MLPARLARVAAESRQELLERAEHFEPPRALLPRPMAVNRRLIVSPDPGAEGGVDLFAVHDLLLHRLQPMRKAA